MKKIGTVFASCIAAAISFGVAQAETKSITIATEGGFAPYNLTRADGQLDGYEVELGNHLCKTVGIECTFVAQAFDGIIPALNAGKYEAIMAGLSMTAKRKEVVDFSISYGRVPQAIAVLNDSPLASLKHDGETYSLANDEAGAQKAIDDIKGDLEGKIVGVQTASIGSILIKHFLDGVVEVREYKTTEEHDLDLKAGRVDFTVASIAYLTALQKKPGFDSVKVVGPHFQGGLLGPGIGMAFRKGEDELKVKFDAAIQTAIDDGTVKTLAEKWFGFDITPK